MTTRFRRLLAEAAGVVVAAALGLIVVTHLAGTPRSALLFSDGDSLLPPLVAASLRSGQPQDWAMTDVLFLPELAVYLGLTLLGLSMRATLMVNGVLNLVALYGAFRMVAALAPRSTTAGRMQAALAASGLFAALALLDSSADRNALELASLMATTTYYSSSVIAAIVLVALTARSATGAGRRVRVLLTVVCAAATCTNPIVVAWALLPLLVVLAGGVAVRLLAWRAAGRAGSLLVVGAAAGMLARLPFAPWIVDSPARLMQPQYWRTAAAYYGALVQQRLQLDGGDATAAIVVLGSVVAVTTTVVAARRREPVVFTVAAAAWLMPLTAAAGVVLLGTQAARYLEPVAFAGPMLVAALPALLPADRGALAEDLASTARLAVAAAALVVTGVSVAVALPAAARDAAAVDPSTRCVDDWVAAAARADPASHGAGQYWTVRDAKAGLRDPSRLVQVDENLRAYAWLVDRADFTTTRVSYLVVDARSLPYPHLPTATPQRIACGTFTILDYGRPILRLGPTHS